MDHLVESALKSYISFFERMTESVGTGRDRFIVQKAHIVAKYPSSTPCYDDPRQGINQYGQEVPIRVDWNKLFGPLNWQPPQEAAVGGQADQDDDLNRKWAVYRHLEAVVEMASPRNHLQGRLSNSGSTTVAASVPWATSSTRMQGRSASTFRSFSFRSVFCQSTHDQVWDMVAGLSVIPDLDIGRFRRKAISKLCPVEFVKYCKTPVFSIQLDVLDLLTRHPTSTLGKRLCTAVDYFGQLSPRCLGVTSGGNEFRQPKKITGVRKRGNKYVAEVKPPGSKGRKVHLGQFSTQPEAARARDVGCYLYHRDKERMFYKDTPQIISTLLTSTGCNAEDELSKFAGLDEGEKEKIVKEVAKSMAKEQAEKLSSMHPRNPKTMRTSMKTDISQNRVHITEQTVALECSELEPRRCAFEQSEIRETTSEFSDSGINEGGGTLTTDREQSRLSGIEEWLGSVILDDPSTPSTVQLRSPDELQIDQMEQPLEVSTEASESGASDQVSAMILELMEEQDMCQRSVEHVAGHLLTNLETFGSMDFALSMTYQSMNLAASPSEVGSPSDGYSLWESGAQAMALDGLGLWS